MRVFEALRKRLRSLCTKHGELKDHISAMGVSCGQNKNQKKSMDFKKKTPGWQVSLVCRPTPLSKTHRVAIFSPIQKLSSPGVDGQSHLGRKIWRRRGRILGKRRMMATGEFEKGQEVIDGWQPRQKADIVDIFVAKILGTFGEYLCHRDSHVP